MGSICVGGEDHEVDYGDCHRLPSWSWPLPDLMSPTTRARAVDNVLTKGGGRERFALGENGVRSWTIRLDVQRRA